MFIFLKLYKRLSMASIRDLAILSAMAYNLNEARFADWVKIRNITDPSGKGFSAVIFVKVQSKEVVLAIRGTDFDLGDKSDFISDVQIALSISPGQLTKAEQSYELAKHLALERVGNKYTLYLTGHSLGGGLASLLSAKKGGLPTVTFNSPGMKSTYIGGLWIPVVSLWNAYNLSYVKKSRMLHIRSSGDLVSRLTGPHIGTEEKVYVQKWGDKKILGVSRHLEQHSIKNMIEAMEKIPWTLEELGWNTGFQNRY